MKKIIEQKLREKVREVINKKLSNEGFAYNLSKKDKKKFESQIKVLSNQLGYKLVEGKLNEAEIQLIETDYDKIKLPTGVNRYLEKFVQAMKSAGLNRIKRSAVLFKVIDATGMTPQQLMRDITRIKKELGEEKLTESYKDSKWEVYVGDDAYGKNRKVVKVAKSKRAATILYNKLIKTDKYFEVGMRAVKENVENKFRKLIKEMVREEFGGALPKKMRKEFDNQRRKNSEVLGYKLTGKDDIRTEIEDEDIKENKVEEQLRGQIRNILKEVMYTMGARGLQAVETGVIHLEKNSVYYMGASSSPDQIIITKVDDNYIEYVKPIDNNSRKLKIERPIGESLILDGSNTWLKTYGRFKENKKIADTLQKNLDGKKGSNNGKVKPSEYDRYVLTIQGTKGSNDVYGAAKQWGVVGPWNGKNGEEAEIELEVYKIYIPYVKKDKQLKIIKQKKGEL